MQRNAQDHVRCEWFGAELNFVEGSTLGPCPETALMCGRGVSARGTLECQDDCHAHGNCKQGVCHCHVGYVGSTCGQRICWKASQCANGEVCDSSGECLQDGAGSAPPPPNPPPPPPPAPPPGFYAYGDWSICPETCLGGQGMRTRNYTCGGDCSSLGTPVVTTPCPPQPCLDTACSTNPCGSDNLCSVQEFGDSVEVTCVCVDGSSGELCQLDEGGCHVDVNGNCCPAGQPLAITGECCSSPGMSLDRDGYCCWANELDPCRICGGQTALVDSYGTCCPVTTVDADGVCCMDTIDVCGMLLTTVLSALLLLHASVVDRDRATHEMDTCYVSSSQRSMAQVSAMATGDHALLSSW